VDLQRAPSASRLVLTTNAPYASLARLGLPRLTPDNATEDWKGRRHPTSRRPASPLRTSRRLIRPISCSPILLRVGGTPAPEESLIGGFRSRTRLGHIRFNSQPVSISRFNSTSVLATAQIPAQTGFLIGTRVSASRARHDFSRDRVRSRSLVRNPTSRLPLAQRSHSVTLDEVFGSDRSTSARKTSSVRAEVTGSRQLRWNEIRAGVITRRSGCICPAPVRWGFSGDSQSGRVATLRLRTSL
jgi:hypothetical protein